jgi:phage portal protein BeeE
MPSARVSKITGAAHLMRVHRVVGQVSRALDLVEAKLYCQRRIMYVDISSHATHSATNLLKLHPDAWVFFGIQLKHLVL